jgi:hypothetical protein
MKIFSPLKLFIPTPSPASSKTSFSFHKTHLLLKGGAQIVDDHITPIVPITNVLQEEEAAEENPIEAEIGSENEEEENS